MNILIVGGCGFIGSHLVDRFRIDAHKVFIIDNLVSGNKANVNAKHTMYELDAGSDSCEKIFRASSFDIVVYSAPVSYKKDENNITSNINGLANILRLSHKYTVKKFVFISSASIYGNSSGFFSEDTPINPADVYGISSYIGESLIQFYSKTFNLNAICIRLSNIYGPRMSSCSSDFYKTLLTIYKGHKISIPDVLKEGIDLLYVKDAADAIHMLSLSSVSDTINISTGKKVSIDNILDVTKTLFNLTNYEYVSSDTKITKPILDNSKALKELDWTNVTNLSLGIFEAINFIKNSNMIEDKKDKEPKHSSKIFSFIIPYIENIILFVLFAYLTSDGFLLDSIDVDFMFIYLLIMALAYGINQASISFFLASGLKILRELSNGNDIAYVIYDTKILLAICFYFIIGIGTGYIINKLTHNIASSQKTIHQLTLDNELLNKVYEENIIIKNDLQEQIIGFENSFGKVFSIVSQLDSLEIEEIYNSSIDVIKGLTKANTVLLYVKDRTGNYLRLSAKNTTKPHVDYSIKLSDIGSILIKLSSHDIFVNTMFDDKLPMIAAPILYNNNFIAVVMLDDIPFERLNTYYINLIKITCQLISSAVIKSFLYNNALEEKKYVSGTYILLEEWFLKVLIAKINARHHENSTFSLIKVTFNRENQKKLSDIIFSSVRDTDYMGLYKGDLYIILSNSTPIGSETVLNRLKSRGAEAILLKEDNIIETL